VQGRRRQWLLALATGAAVCVVAIALVLWWALRDVPWKEIADGSLRPVVVLESFDGEQIVSQGPFQAGYVPIEEFPQHLIDAVVSTEDRRFYEHSGIDLRGIARAFVSNVTAGEVVQGGSTITQQLVKILYLERDRTYKRKLQEAVIAFWLESRLTKDEILGRYLNNIYLGAGATGVPAAARVYFNKEVSELNLSESAMLAGIIRAPSHFSPTTNPEGARTRAATVLRTMVANGKLDNAEAEAAAAEYTELNITTPAERSGNWFADWVMDDARQIAGPYRGSIMVRTTLVPALQEIAERVVAEALDERGEEAGVSQAALVAMTPDGSVLAMVGGKDYAESEFNRAVDAMRQPGSTFKLFVYYAALKAGIGLRDRVVDEPIEIDGWTPENFGERYYGPVSIAEAFARSLNAATVALAMEVGIDNVVAAARELGIDAELVATPALALGASEVSLLDLTAAYASVRAGVAPVEPWGIASFHASDQDRSFMVGPETQPATDLSQYQDELVRLLQLVVERGTGKAAAFGAFAAGKTGTSQNNRDAWFVGFSEPLVVGVWVGNDDDSPMNDVTGGNLPATIWRNFMEQAIAGPPQASAGAQAGDGSEQTAIACNVRACQRAYRSFRASDCTFQPYDGPRRLCEK
jgi:1A family penicillin-binding protein